MPPHAANPCLQLDMCAAGSPRQPSVAQQQLVAEATVAVAFQHRQPLLMLRAGGAFRRLEQFAAAQVNGTELAAAQLSSCLCCSWYEGYHGSRHKVQAAT